MDAVVLNRAVRSARKPKGGGHERRGEILVAAAKIFNNLGYDGATIRRIADEVGLSSTALYMHFRDKSEILVEISQSAFAQVIAQNDSIAAAEPDPVVRVRKILEAYVDFGLAQPHTYLLVFNPSEAILSEEKAAALDALGLKTYERFRESVAEIAAQGRLRTDDVDAATQAAWMSAHGLTSLLISRSNFPWAEHEKLKALVLDSLFNGLLKK